MTDQLRTQQLLNVWRERPERSAAAAVAGMVLCWSAAVALAFGMVEIQPGTASVSGREFLMWMAAPVLVGAVLSGPWRVRFFAGAVVPGFTVGWVIGCAPMVFTAVVVKLC